MTNPASVPLNPEPVSGTRRLLSPHHFPQYSQLDPRWEFEPATERTMCGIICTKAILDFYSPDQSTPTVHELVSIVALSEGMKPKGLSHAVEVGILKSQGLVAWRRNWEAPSSDPTWLVENEGYDSEQVDAITRQLSDEVSGRGITEAELISIKKSLEDHNPVIVSVGANFGGNQADHQVVVTEISKDGQHIVIMDPEQKPGTEIRTETIDRFVEFFNHRAIFTRQA